METYENKINDDYDSLFSYLDEISKIWNHRAF